MKANKKAKKPSTSGNKTKGPSRKERIKQGRYILNLIEYILDKKEARTRSSMIGVPPKFADSTRYRARGKAIAEYVDEKGISEDDAKTNLKLAELVNFLELVNEPDLIEAVQSGSLPLTRRTLDKLMRDDNFIVDLGKIIEEQI